MTSSSELWAIGAFSKRVRLSVKTLRLYQEKELLAPAWIDPWTGYRYYQEAQERTARRIVQLRSLGFSLREIREVLDHAPDEPAVVALLQKQREQVTARMSTIHQTLERLDAAILQSTENHMHREQFAMDTDPSPRLEQWLARLQSESRAEQAGALHNLTISSAWGAAGGGDTLAAALGKRVAFDVWDRTLIASLASDRASATAIMDTLDDAQRAASKATLETAGVSDQLPTSVRNELGIVAALATHGGAVFLEMGTHCLLSPEQALRVRLVPIREKVIPHHAKRNQVDLDIAEREVEAENASLAGFVQETFGRDAGDPADYDIILNSATTNLFTAVDLCVQAYEARFSPEPGWWFA